MELCYQSQGKYRAYTDRGVSRWAEVRTNGNKCRVNKELEEENAYG
jgi:hypothetical protein